LKLAFRLSWAANWLLLGLKIAAFVVSRSKAVLASLADSGGAPLARPAPTC
jgi:divalent metal cation (Fe/Co/Zn/Cd) transporter